jgi:preprotein translocase subunit SecE
MMIPDIVKQGMQFLQDVRVEMKKVSWPTRKEALGSTAVVIVVVLLIATFLGIVDLGLSLFVGNLLK